MEDDIQEILDNSRNTVDLCIAGMYGLDALKAANGCESTQPCEYNVVEPEYNPTYEPFTASRQPINKCFYDIGIHMATITESQQRVLEALQHLRGHLNIN